MAETKGIPRDPRIKYHFKREEFDFFFQWLAGASTHGGAEVGESFYAASQIEEGNVESWIRAWTELAGRVAARGETSRAGGHRVSARESFLRAYTYHRAPLMFISPLDEPGRYRRRYEQARAYFRQAAKLFDPPLEPFEVPFEVPFEGAVLPGYFVHVDDSGTPRKTLIMIGGGDTFVEDLYAYIGPAATKRGYNVLMVDLPGQGALPFEGLTWRADVEVPMAAVVDYALARPDVDPEQLVTYGISGGGYLVPRAVTAEKRLKAAVACSAILDFTQAWDQDFIALHEKAERPILYRAVKRFMQWYRGAYFTLVDTYVWRFGAESVPGLIDASEDCVVDPGQITCPLLNVLSEQEYAESTAIREWAERCERELAHPNHKLVVMPQDEGADSHAIDTNLSLMSQVVFDWLDDVLDAPTEGADRSAQPPARTERGGSVAEPS